MPTFLSFSRFPSILLALLSAGGLFFGAGESLRAQAPTFGFTARVDNNENNDSSARVRRPSPAVRNVPTSSDATPTPSARLETPADARSQGTRSSQAAEIWAAFLFGTPNRPVSSPKFAFARRSEAEGTRRDGASVAASLPTDAPTTVERLRPLPQSTRTAETSPIKSLSQTAQTPRPISDEELAAARRRRLRELDALLAASRPEEYSRRLALASAAAAVPTKPSESLDVPTLAEPKSALAPSRAEFVRENADAPFDAARANRSKIRQASALEPAPLELADDGFAAFVLPTRPNALRLSPNVFLSTDLVRLPSAASLDETQESAKTPESPRPLAAERPSSSVETPLSQAVPLAEAPAEPAASTDVPTLRPTATFVEPRFLPTRP
ncbi:MAG: hypothetical protein IKU86_08990 [Thermoguttaceae bacterium]|nr:hypothetical protein [Thermoguttaceae bacterium]